MKNFHKIVAITLSNLCLSSAVFADSWQIIQGVDTSNVGGDTTLLQTNSTDNNSVQSLNTINLDQMDGTVNTGSNQTVKIGSNTLSLVQDNGTSQSKQSVNTATAKTINDLTQVLEGSGGTIQLDQSNTGDANTQAINAVKANKIIRLRQKIVAPNTELKLNQDNVEKNTQAGNLITIGGSLSTAGIEQSIAVKSAEFAQNSTNQTLQAGNALLMGNGSVATGGGITQKFSTNGGELNLIQNQAAGSHQSANYAGISTSN